MEICEFVSFSIAKKLKEKGFPQYTEKSYFVGDHKKRMCSVGTFLHVHTQNTEHLIAAPTISQVLKWLREEKKIHIEISPKWQYTVYDMRCNPWIGYSDMQNYDDYTMAAIAGIEYCLDNLI